MERGDKDFLIEDIFGSEEAKKAKKLNNKKNIPSFEEVMKKERREHAMIMALTASIVLLLIFVGYSMYSFYDTKSEATSQIFSLNGAITSLSLEKSHLNQSNTNLTLEITQLNEEINELTEQRTLLVEENNRVLGEYNDLELDLASLQEDYDTLAEELQTAEEDLADCEDACP